MPQALILQPTGLYTNPNPLSATPPGGMAIANNIVIDQPGSVRSRRGLPPLTDELEPGDVAHGMFAYRDGLIVATRYAGLYDLLYYRAAGGAFTRLYPDSTVPKVTPHDTGLSAAESQRSIFIASYDGVLKVDSPTSLIKLAGLQPAADVYSSTTPLGSSFSPSGVDWLATTKAAIYRIVWGRRDANNILLRSAPSGQYFVRNNTGGSTCVSLTIPIPSDITPSDFIQVYRSKQADAPADDLFLTYEANPTSGEVAAGQISINDFTFDNLLGEALYTNDLQQGIAASAYPPPWCKDICAWEGRLWGGNILGAHRKEFALLATSTGSSARGLKAGDTVVIRRVDTNAVVGTLTGVSGTPNYSIGQFKVLTSGTVTQNIEDTTKELARAINTYSSTKSILRGTYLLGSGEPVGKLVIDAIKIGPLEPTYKFTATTANIFSPAMDGSVDTYTTRDEKKNGLWFSAFQQPDSVPLANRIYPGSEDAALLRIVPLQHSLFVFKEDGIFRVTPAGGGNFSVEHFDRTSALLWPRSIAVLANQIFAVTTQGVVTLSESGPRVVSLPIEQDLQVITAATGRNSVSFAVSYESDRKYVLAYSPDGTTAPTRALVYNHLTQAWTSWKLPATVTCGIVNPKDDLLHLGTNSNIVLRENKTHTPLDFYDVSYGTQSSAIAYLGSNVYQVNLGDNFSNTALPGDALKCVRTSDGRYCYAIILSVSGPFQFTVYCTQSITDCDQVTHYGAIECEIEFVTQAVGSPSVLKHFREAQVHFRSREYRQLRCQFRTELYPDDPGAGSFPVDLAADLGGSEGATILIEDSPKGVFTSFLPPSVPTETPGVARMYVPRRAQRAAQLQMYINHRQALTGFLLSGVTYVYTGGTDERVHK